MTRYIGCIDLHNGQVKQIVGGTLTDDIRSNPDTNFISNYPSTYYAQLLKDNDVTGSHVIKLGDNNDQAALDALKLIPNFLQIGGGINDDNCLYWLQYGSKIIVTSWLFDSENGNFLEDRLISMSRKCGSDRIVVDLSCRKIKIDNSNEFKWVVAMNKWQKLTNLELNEDTFIKLSQYTKEFLIHAADVEGLCNGIDEELVIKLNEWTEKIVDVRIVYAGGAKSIKDLELVKRLSNGRVDLTFGSSLDIFGGKLVKFADCVEWNKKEGKKNVNVV